MEGGGKGGTLLRTRGAMKGYLLIRDLWMKGTDNVHDIHVVNTDANSYQSKKPNKCLENADK